LLKNIISTLFTKGFVALVNLAILLVSAKMMGSDVRGQISLLALNIAIIQVINEVYTGYALVYFIPNNSVKKLYVVGVLWTIGCTIVCTSVMLLLFHWFDIGSNTHWLHLFILSFIIILHSFHMVIILAKEKIKIYNFLNFLQPTLVLLSLIVALVYLKLTTVEAYIGALYFSFIIAILISSFQIISILKNQKDHLPVLEPKEILRNGFLIN